MHTDPAIGGSAPAAAPAPTDPAATTEESPAADTGFVCSKPLMMIGAAGDDVAELGFLLAAKGYPNAVSDGTAEAPPILDDALMRIVVDFQQANGINPWEAEGGNGQPTLRSAHIGCVDARTWESLLGYQPKVIAQGATA